MSVLNARGSKRIEVSEKLLWPALYPIMESKEPRDGGRLLEIARSGREQIGGGVRNPSVIRANYTVHNAEAFGVLHANATCREALVY